VDLNALLRNVSGLLEAEWEKAGIRFALQLALDLTPVTADEELLRQAFLNLMLNACQAMPKGGTVSVTTARRPRDNREMLTVAIADEGIGIAPEDQDKIFKLYYTTKPDGSGIGLSLVYRIVQMHDGVIEVDSVVDKGTTMTVWLPAC
jgi:signal transduction histidine kinase